MKYTSLKMGNLKLDSQQISCLENIVNKRNFTQMVYDFIIKEYQLDEKEIIKLKNNIDKSFDLLIKLKISDQNLIFELILWNTIIKEKILEDIEIQNFIYSSNLRCKDLLSVLRIS